MAKAEILDALTEAYGMTLSPNEVATVLHLHPTHVRAMCQEGKLPAVKFGNRWRIPTVKLAELLEEGGLR